MPLHIIRNAYLHFGLVRVALWVALCAIYSVRQRIYVCVCVCGWKCEHQIVLFALKRYVKSISQKCSMVASMEMHFEKSFCTNGNFVCDFPRKFNRFLENKFFGCIPILILNNANARTHSLFIIQIEKQ